MPAFNTDYTCSCTSHYQLGGGEGRSAMTMALLPTNDFVALIREEKRWSVVVVFASIMCFLSSSLALWFTIGSYACGAFVLPLILSVYIVYQRILIHEIPSLIRDNYYLRSGLRPYQEYNTELKQTYRHCQRRVQQKVNVTDLEWIKKTRFVKGRERARMELVLQQNGRIRRLTQQVKEATVLEHVLAAMWQPAMTLSNNSDPYGIQSEPTETTDQPKRGKDIRGGTRDNSANNRQIVTRATMASHTNKAKGLSSKEVRFLKKHMSIFAYPKPISAWALKYAFAPRCVYSGSLEQEQQFQLQRYSQRPSSLYRVEAQVEPPNLKLTNDYYDDHHHSKSRRRRRRHRHRRLKDKKRNSEKNERNDSKTRVKKSWWLYPPHQNSDTSTEESGYGSEDLLDEWTSSGSDGDDNTDAETSTLGEYVPPPPPQQ